MNQPTFYRGPPPPQEWDEYDPTTACNARVAAARWRRLREELNLPPTMTLTEWQQKYVFQCAGRVQ